jgi:hypothetical protein
VLRLYTELSEMQSVKTLSSPFGDGFVVVSVVDLTGADHDFIDHRNVVDSAFCRMSDMMRLAITRFYSVFPANSGIILSNKPQGFTPCPNHLCAVGSARAGL